MVSQSGSLAELQTLHRGFLLGRFDGSDPRGLLRGIMVLDDFMLHHRPCRCGVAERTTVDPSLGDAGGG